VRRNQPIHAHPGFLNKYRVRHQSGSAVAVRAHAHRCTTKGVSRDPKWDRMVHLAQVRGSSWLDHFAVNARLFALYELGLQVVAPAISLGELVNGDASHFRFSTGPAPIRITEIFLTMVTVTCELSVGHVPHRPVQFHPGISKTVLACFGVKRNLSWFECLRANTRIFCVTNAVPLSWPLFF